MDPGTRLALIRGMNRSLKHLVLLPALTTLLIPASAAAFELRKDSDGLFLFWASARAELEVDVSSLPSVKAGQVLSGVRGAFSAWTTGGVPVKCRVANKVGPGAATKDGHNMVRWIHSDWAHGKEAVAITISWYRASTGEVLESDILANAEHHKWGVNPSKGTGRYDIQNVMAHEAGHFLGLGHSKVASATMWPDSRPIEVAKRTLDKDDRDGIVALVAAAGMASRSQASTTSEELDPRYAGGCSVARGESSGVGAAGLLVLALGLMFRRRRALAGALALLAALTAGQAEAGTRHGAAEVETLAGSAPLVFRAEVLVSQSRMWRGLIVTDHTVRIASCYKGDCGKTATVRTLGGVLGDLGMHVEGAAKLQPGDEAVLFARRQGATVRPLGLGRGVLVLNMQLKVVKGGAAARLATLERKIRHGIKAARRVSTNKTGGQASMNMSKDKSSQPSRGVTSTPAASATQEKK